MREHFKFGVGTADHQCEAYDGRDDIRDVWERVRGMVPRGRATDFWNRYREDVDLAKGLGCRIFRISLAWARLEPEAGVWDEAAFAHYHDVLQYIRDAGMDTVVSLCHNTWPLWVQAAGGGAGMLDLGFPERLARYAGEVAKRLGHLVDYYVTLNEPNQLVYGYIKGFWMRAYPVPPGLPPFATSDQQMEAVLRLIPNLFRAHASARSAIRAVTPKAKVGANPLVLGLPRWLQRLVDRNATQLRSPAQALRQARRLSQHWILDAGKVDVSIAQVAMTQERMSRVLFSEPYAMGKPVLLHASSLAVPERFDDWKVRIGVVTGAVAADNAGGVFPDAAVEYYSDAGGAVAALRAGTIDAVYDLDLILKQFAVDGLVLSSARSNSWPIGVVMALGSRALLNAVDRALREFNIPNRWNRKTIAHVGTECSTPSNARRLPIPNLDRSLLAIRKRGFLRVGIRPGVEGLCMPEGSGGYQGLEPDIARAIARGILGTDDPQVRFVVLSGDRRWNATRSVLSLFNDFRKSLGMFGTLIGTNWWNLGMAGRLPAFLCPPECVGSLDYVGLDYYWGIPNLWPGQLHRLTAAAEAHYALAPVWPSALDGILREADQQFPGKPIVVVENGCVTSADGFSRAKYLEAHIAEVERAWRRGAPIDAYLWWSITSNREWGLPFDNSSDFGLYHVDLDTDEALARVPTESSRLFQRSVH